MFAPSLQTCKQNAVSVWNFCHIFGFIRKRMFFS